MRQFTANQPLTGEVIWTIGVALPVAVGVRQLFFMMHPPAPPYCHRHLIMRLLIDLSSCICRASAGGTFVSGGAAASPLFALLIRKFCFPTCPPMPFIVAK